MFRIVDDTKISSFEEESQRYLYIEDIQGSKMIFPRKTRPFDYERFFGMMLYRCWEPEETKFMKDFVKEGMTVVDIGANIGYYTLLLSNLVGEKGKVLAVEPSDEYYKVCKMSVDINNYTNVVLCNCLVGDVEKNSNFDNENLVVTSNSAIEKMTTTLDKLISEKVDFVKIDTDGYDSNVILGMTEHFVRNPELVVMLEYCPALWNMCGVGVREFLNDIPKSYLFYDIKGNRVEIGKLSDIDEMSLNPMQMEKLFAKTLIIRRK